MVGDVLDSLLVEIEPDCFFLPSSGSLIMNGMEQSTIVTTIAQVPLIIVLVFMHCSFSFGVGVVVSWTCIAIGVWFSRSRR